MNADILEDEYLPRLFLNIFQVLFTIIVLFVELEWTGFLRDTRLLTFWPSRGITYVFFGLLSFEQNLTSEERTNLDSFVDAYLQIFSYAIACYGAGYIFMGMLCLQRLYRGQQRKYLSRKNGGGDISKIEVVDEKLSSLGNELNDLEMA